MTEGGFSNEIISKSLQMGGPNRLFIPRLTIQANLIDESKIRKSPPKGNLKGKFIELRKISKMDDLVKL